VVLGGEKKNMISFISWYCICSYSLIVLCNFFTPITMSVGITCLVLSLLCALLFARKEPLSIESVYTREVNSIGLFLVLALAVLFVLLQRPSIDTDASVYHMPLARLMNHSFWYPGIGLMSSHMAFANGSSVLTSAFTSFGIQGVEHVPNIMIWVLLGMATYVFSRKKNLPVIIASIMAVCFLLTPDMFWRMNNLGTDLPCACFILLALLFFSEKKWDDALLMAAFAGTFKPMGLLSAGFIFVVVLWNNRSTIPVLFKTKCLIAYLLIALNITRMFVATGNPLFPMIPLKLVPWGASLSMQENLIRAIRVYALPIRSITTIIPFFVNFVLSPSMVKSSYWFSPLFGLVSLGAAMCFIKERVAKKPFNIHILVISLLIAFLLSTWFMGSPLFRFIAGVLMYLLVEFFAYVYDVICNRALKGLFIGVLCLVVGLFAFNVYQHFKNNIVPFIKEPGTRQHMPYKREDAYTIVTLPDGFTYTRSDWGYCGYFSPPPYFHAWSMESEEEIIARYRKWNKV